MTTLPPPLRVRWLGCVNESGLAIPARALLRIVGVNAAGQLRVDRPRADGLGNDAFAVCGPQGIPARQAGNSPGTGVCTCDWPAEVLYDDSSGAPANGEVWGPAKDRWELERGHHGFWVAGVGVGPRAALVLPLPREVAVVRKTSNVPDANGYYPGRVEHWDAVSRSWTGVADCRILDANG